MLIPLRDGIARVSRGPVDSVAPRERCRLGGYPKKTTARWRLLFSGLLGLYRFVVLNQVLRPDPTGLVRNVDCRDHLVAGGTLAVSHGHGHSSRQSSDSALRGGEHDVLHQGGRRIDRGTAVEGNHQRLRHTTLRFATAEGPDHLAAEEDLIPLHRDQSGTSPLFPNRQLIGLAEELVLILIEDGDGDRAAAEVHVVRIGESQRVRQTVRGDCVALGASCWW